MTIRIDEPISFNGNAYAGVREIGFADDGHFIVDLWTTPAPEPRGSYFTCLPISPLSYRKTLVGRYTKTSVTDRGDSIGIASDWGQVYVIKASRTILDALLAECDANEIPRLTEA